MLYDFAKCPSLLSLGDGRAQTCLPWRLTLSLVSPWPAAPFLPGMKSRVVAWPLRGASFRTF